MRAVDPTLTPEESAIKAEREIELHNALANLDSIDRQIVELRDFQGLGNKDAALHLGLTPQSASMRYLRAKRRLRAILEET